MSVESFIDTNVFIYHLEKADARRFMIADTIIREAIATGSACISFQVVQECLNTMLRKASIPLDTAGMRDYLDIVLLPLMRVPASADLYRRSLEVRERYGFSFYDALIVAAALEAGCTRLWSEDLQHGQHIGVLQVENPFRA